MTKPDILFTPYRLNGLVLSNRVVMAPMTRSLSPGGVSTSAMADYYRRRAENGVGLIITEATGVDRPGSVNEPYVPRFHGEAALAAWRRVVDEVHAAGGRIAAQLWHVGAKRSKATPDWVPPGGYESPSGLSLSGKPAGEPMSETAIADTIGAFVRGAVEAERIGFDGIELHAAHNYLIAQFFTDRLNRREDRFGGRSLIERSRFAVEILKGIRGAVSPGFPVILRLSLSQPTSHERSLVETPQQLEEWLAPFVEAGTDAFDMSQANYADAPFPDVEPDLSLAGWARKLTGVTSIAVGSIGLSVDTYASFSGKTAHSKPIDGVLARLDRGEFDLVAVGRPLLRDPAWLEKIRLSNTDAIADVKPDDIDVLY